MRNPKYKMSITNKKIADIIIVPDEFSCLENVA